jgi:hypothetical protein
MNDRLVSRRDLGSSALGFAASLALAGELPGAGAARYRLATFAADVTPPVGHALMGGGILPARTIDDPLFAHGFVLLGAGKPVVLAAVDWCEIRNDAHERWRAALAQAAQTSPERVLVTCIHQHDAPVADLEAQRILQQHKAAGSICDLKSVCVIRSHLSPPRKQGLAGASG